MKHSKSSQLGTFVKSERKNGSVAADSVHNLNQQDKSHVNKVKIMKILRDPNSKEPPAKEKLHVQHHTAEDAGGITACEVKTVSLTDAASELNDRISGAEEQEINNL